MTKLPKDYRIIMEEIVPDILERFTSKASDYGDAYKLLGSKGQFSDINRKFWKLYKSVWLGEKLKGEQPAECAEDIIGHCLLLILLLHQEEREESTPDPPVISSIPTHAPHVNPGSDRVDSDEDPDEL